MWTNGSRDEKKIMDEYKYEIAIVWNYFSFKKNDFAH